MADLKIAIVGRGYSVSTFLAYAPWDKFLEWKSKGNQVLVDFYGGADPWEKAVRGEGIVNHAKYMWSRA